MKTRRPIFRLLPVLLCGILATELSAREVRMRAVTMAGRQPGNEVFVHDLDGGSGTGIRVKSFLNHQFDRVSVNGTTLFLTTASNPGSRHDEDQLLAELEIPADWDSVIVLFVPATGDRRVDARLIDDSATAFPAGSFLVVSQCEDPLKIELEGEAYEIEPKATRVILDPPKGENPGMFQMTASRKAEDEWEQVAIGRWANPGDSRELQVASVHPRSGRVEIRGVKDVASVK